VGSIGIEVLRTVEKGKSLGEVTGENGTRQANKVEDCHSVLRNFYQPENIQTTKTLTSKQLSEGWKKSSQENCAVGGER